MAFACKNCRLITNSRVCPNCGGETTSSFQGMIVIFDVESEVAKKLNITKPGKYAIKV